MKHLFTSVKRMVFYAASFSFLFSIVSCDRSDDMSVTSSSKTPYVCKQCIQEPTALPGNDNSSNGVYKGVFSGGTLQILVYNGDDKVSGSLLVNDNLIDLSPLSTDLNKDKFSTVLRGYLGQNKFSLRFSVDKNGDSPKISEFSMPGSSDVNTIVLKEKSSSLLEEFSGNYFAGDDGVNGGVSKLIDDSFPQQKIGSAQLVLSRKDAYWYSISTINGETNISDYGRILGVNLISNISRKSIGSLISDQISGYESNLIPQANIYMYSIRVR